MPRRIAIVEDEITIRRNFEDALRRQGFQVSGYANRKSALNAFSGRLPDLVIIDVGLGDDVEGGFELCKELRAMSRVLPIMFLTARDSDVDMISGLRLGALANPDHRPLEVHRCTTAGAVRPPRRPG